MCTRPFETVLRARFAGTPAPVITIPEPRKLTPEATRFRFLPRPDPRFMIALCRYLTPDPFFFSHPQPIFILA